MAKIALVTGATKGIGLAISKQLLEEGYFVYGISISESGYLAVKEELTDDFKWLSCDVSNLENVKESIAKITHDQVDLIVNNAGYIDSGYRTEDLPVEELHKLFEINVYGTFYVIQELMSKVNLDSGVIINVSSNAGKRGVPKIAGYSSAKFAILGLTQSMAKENLDKGFRIYTLCPGGTNTQMREKIFGDAANYQSPDFVAEVVMSMVNGKIALESGDDVVVARGEVFTYSMPKR
jgi:acetoacetyl-CoA reductase